MEKQSQKEQHSVNKIKKAVFFVLESAVWLICGFIKAGLWVINLIFVNILINSFLKGKK